MKKRIIAVAVLLSVAGYVLPFVVTKAGSDPSNPAVLPGAPTTLTLRVTAYASVPNETDNTPFITANGTYVHDGIIASNLFPFGTQIMIPSLFGNKVFTVEDRTSPQFKNSIDVWMPSVGKAIYFGVHHVAIVVIPPGPTLADNTTSTNSVGTLAIAKK